MANIGEITSDIAGAIGRATKRAGQTVADYAGLAPSGLAPEQEAHGMNPRRAYLSAAMLDLAQFGTTGQMRGMGQQVNRQQQQHIQAIKARQARERYNEMIGSAAMMNANRGAAGTQAMRNAAAMGLKPGTQAYNDYIRQVTTKPLVDMGSEIQNQFMDQLPDAYTAASAAASTLARYDTMEKLIPRLGQTGPGKNAMTNFRGGLNALGMSGAANFIDALSEAAGADFFSGDQGAAEFFRALGTRDILSQAKKLYPVTDRDIRFLEQMAPMLSISDPDAMMDIIQQGREEANRDIEYYNYIQSNSPPGAGARLPTIKPWTPRTADQEAQDARFRKALGLGPDDPLPGR